MRRNLRGFAATFALSLALAAPIAEAQKIGRRFNSVAFRQPGLDIDAREATGAVNRPMMGVFNNLVMYRQDAAQNSMASIVPDLATEWSGNEEGTELTLPLRQGVRWHDGRPFTAKDVKCTWDLLTDRSAEKLRVNPRKNWYSNLEEVTTNSDYEVTFHLKRSQPSFLALLASGWSPVYPCHVSPRELRMHPIGTGPFKFVEFRPNERIRVARNRSTGNPAGPTSMVSSGQSFRACRRASWGLSPAVSIRSSA
jgi:peptide/nickel transport system substrate-binding protein